jgi:ABC-2 type transport system permease protein/Cu-processing system permease protein
MRAKIGSARAVMAATVVREFVSYRLNLFLYAHAALMLAVGVLALLAPPTAAVAGTSWWVLNGVVYIGSLSALLFGLSSAQAEADELSQMLAQPIETGWWILGKCTGLFCVLAPSALLLVLPTILFAGGSPLLAIGAAAAAGVCVLFSWCGLALGLWVTNPVRGLLSALALWCVLLFAADFALMLTGGATWVHENPAPWIAVLMASPLDAYRVMLLFTLERAAFSGAELHPLTRWWVAHPAAWVALCLSAWSAMALLLAMRAAARRRYNGTA